MLHSKFQEVLDHFNSIESTDAKCECIFMSNFVVSGLATDEMNRLSVVYKYNPDRFLGTGIISNDVYKMCVKANTAQTEPHYSESWVANLSRDMLDCMSGHLTHGKVYDILENKDECFIVVSDKGYEFIAHRSWFTPVKLYDEDETELTCRDIDFEVGDWIDLSKHTPDQIKQVAKSYCFYDVCDLLEDALWTHVHYTGSMWVGNFDLTYNTGKEYHFNDLFYKEGE